MHELCLRGGSQADLHRALVCVEFGKGRAVLRKNGVTLLYLILRQLVQSANKHS